MRAIGASTAISTACMRRMREVLPNACFIAFTGTPIAKKEKSTFAKFGDLVQPSYSMRDAVEDKAVVPLAL